MSEILGRVGRKTSNTSAARIHMGRCRLTALITAGAGFLIAVLWFDLMFDLMFDVQVFAASPIPERPLAVVPMDAIDRSA